MLAIVVPIFTACLSVVEIVLIIVTVYFTRRHFNILRASSYIERFNSEEVVKNRVIVDNWLCLEQNQQMKQLAADPDLNARIRTFANLFQELAVGYFANTVDRHLVQKTFDYLVPSYWQRLQPWIQHVRGADKPTLYNLFEQLAGELKRY